MFDRGRVIAEFDEHFERRYPSKTPESGMLVERIGAAARAENRSAAAQLVAIHELFSYRLSRCSETADWAVDTEEAVAAEVAAELRIGQGLAASRLRYARALRERLPQVGAVFGPGTLISGFSPPSSTAPIRSPMARCWRPWTSSWRPK